MANSLTVHLMYGNGGSGHKATARALHACLSRFPNPPTVILVDASEIAGASAGDWLYNQLLAYNCVSAIDLLHQGLQYIFPLTRPALESAFRRYWRTQSHLNVVVSLVPILNAVFADTLPSSAKLFTVMTDFSHTNAHPWLQHPRQHVITGTDVAWRQAKNNGWRQAGHTGAGMIVTKTNGMVVHPKFYDRTDENERDKRALKMGLVPSWLVVLLLFGGNPPTQVVTQLVDGFWKRGTRDGEKANLIVVCGKNKKLYERLMVRKRRYGAVGIHVVGYSQEIPLFMQMADILVGKPGPGVVSEAYVSGLPCILVTGSADERVMKQERDVMDWVRRKGVGKVVRRVEDAVTIQREEIEHMERNIAAGGNNDALFKVTELIMDALLVQEQQQEEDGIRQLNT